MPDNRKPNVLRPRARILQALGSELISSDVVALSELVKNSYDADASAVLIRIDVLKDQIEVIDDGIGMSLTTLRTVWLEPGTPSKLKKSVSRGGRRVLGAKGIGRFAAARLARKLEVITKERDSPVEAWAEFTWHLFEDPNAYLDEIEIPSHNRKPKEILPGGTIDALLEAPGRRRGLDRGTILRLTGLRQKWDAGQVLALRRALARLISPEGKSSGFSIRLEVIGIGDAPSADDIGPPDLLKYPHYRVVGKINGDGKYRIRYTVYSTGKRVPRSGRFVRQTISPFHIVTQDHRTDPDNVRPIESGPVRLDFRIWDRDELGNVEQRTGSTLKDVRADLDAIAGINIYRDGFRVLPYGEPEDDWLRLDIRRVQKPTMRLSNNQIHGYIGISADENPNLKDQSNREGLVSGPALDDLSDMIKVVLVELENLRYESRPRRDKKGKTGAGKSIFQHFSLENVRDSLGETAEQPKIRKALEVADRQIAEGIKEVQEVLGRYHRLATLGQLIDVVLHDGRQPVAAISNQAGLGLEELSRPNLDCRKALAPRFSAIQGQAQVLATLFKRIEPFGGRRRGRPKQLYMEDIIKDAFSLFEHEMQALKVAPALPESQTLVRVDSAEIQEIIVNLLQNSLYWLKQVPERKRAIVVELHRTHEGHLQMVFSDSGPGVDAQHRDSIFEPYFSTKADGIGLGLTIAGEIASDYYGGSIELLDSGPLPGATFRLTLRKRV
jgi:signal transduction histidine kinase